MGRIILILLLLICGWNVTGSLFFQNRTHFLSDTDSPYSQVKETASDQSLVSQSHHDEKDENSCEDEGCQYHRCHLGHCSFISAPSVSAGLPTWVSLRLDDLEENPPSIYLSFPTKPPLA